MTSPIESPYLATGSSAAGSELCIFCGANHKPKLENALPPATFTRDDEALTQAGRTTIKSDASRSQFYPKSEDGRWVSPLEAPDWDTNTIFNTYLSKGKQRRYAEKYQPPPIHGWIAAPHHMIAVCCMNGTNKLPAKPRVNPWAKRASYDINNGGNCIFVPSSASQFFVAYYLWRVRGTGRPLQGHLGAHRKVYFETVWARLERLTRFLRAEGFCEKTDTEEQRDAIAKAVREELKILEAQLFVKLSAMQPENEYRLGGESYIEIPGDEEDLMKVRANIAAHLQKTYEVLPEWY